MGHVLRLSPAIAFVTVSLKLFSAVSAMIQ